MQRTIITWPLPKTKISCKTIPQINKAVSRQGIDRNLPILEKPVFCLIRC